MIPNPIAYLTQKLIGLFAESEGNEKRVTCIFLRCGEVLVYHNEVSSLGDLSIASHCVNWKYFCRKNQLKLRLEDDAQVKLLLNDESIKKLLEKSRSWIFPLLSVVETPVQRYALRFERNPIVRHVIHSIIEHGTDYGKHKVKDPLSSRTVSITLGTANVEELHHFRQRQLYNIFIRLIEYCDWRLIGPNDKPDDNTLFIRIEPQRTKQEDKNNVTLVCGPVIGPGRVNSSNITSAHYMALRSNDMLLIAMHRHGIRPAPRNVGDSFLMQRLGHAAVMVDLFEVRHTSAKNVVRHGSGCSKGASYILYNSARLETLLRTFNAQVEEGVYPPLPPLNEIDLSLLEDDLDWKLIYGYLLVFPQILESAVTQSEHGHCGIHTLVHFIVDMASQFSRYYRHKQVLVQSREQLMPVLYARVYLIKAVREVLNAALAVLGIEPVDYM